MSNTESSPSEELIAKQNKEIAGKYYSLRARFFDIFPEYRDKDIDFENVIINKILTLVKEDEERNKCSCGEPLPTSCSRCQKAWES